MIEDIANKLRSTNELKPYFSKLTQGKDASLAVVTSARPLVVASDFAADKRSMLVIVAGENNAKVFCNELRHFMDVDDVIEYNIEFNKDKDTPASVAQRFRALSVLHNAQKKIVVASAASILRKIPNTSKQFFNSLKIKIGAEIDFKTLTENLKTFSYTRLESLDGPGTFSVKGGTIDIFPAQLNFPVRIDFFGDEVEEIRRIVQTSGQTIRPMKAVEIFAAKDVEEFEGAIALQDVLNKKTVVYTDEPRGVLDDMRNFYETLWKNYKISRSDKKTFFLDPLKVDFGSNQNVSLVSIMQRGVAADAKLTLKRPPKCKSEEEVNRMIKNYKNQG